jgi:hypothetical protein
MNRPRPKVEGIPVEKRHLVVRAAKRYAKRFSQRPIGGKGLILGILSEPGDGLLENRVRAGVGGALAARKS